MTTSALTHASAAPTSPVRSASRRWAALAVLAASLLVITMDMTILNVALPDLAADLRPSSDEQLWIVDVYSLVLAGLLVPVAAVADRWGRKRTLLTGYAIFGAVSALVMVVHSAPVMIAIRAALGVGGAMIMPTTLSMIRVIFTDTRERATALSVWAAASGLGSVVGPLVGGVLLEHFSWHAAFLVNVPLIAVGLLTGLALLPESRVTCAGHWDLSAAVGALAGITALVWGLKQLGKEASLAVPSAWVAILGALAVLAWFTRRCLASPHPLLDLSLFRSRQFTAGVVAALGATFAMVAALLLVAQWLQVVQGSSPMRTGIQLIPMAAAGIVVSLAAPALSRRIGSRTTLVAGLVVAGAGLLWIRLAGEPTLTTMMVSLVLVGFGMGALAIASAMIMDGAPASKAGAAGAVEETSYELGSTLGVTVLGSVSALVFRHALTGTAAYQALDAVNHQLATQAGDSLGGAVAIAQATGMTDLAQAASSAFTDSLQLAGIVGGALMLAVAVSVWLLTPRGTNVAGGSH